MKVLLIHEQGRSFGSGGQVAMYRLHKGLLRAGVESTIACRRRGEESDDVVELPSAAFVEKWINTVTWRIGLNDIHCVSTFKLKKFKPFLEADVVNIHGPHTNFFNYLALPGLAARKPVICTMHDMWYLTGHCATSVDCERWKSGCGRCPSLDVYPPVGRDGTAIEWKLKNWTYKRAPSLTFVAPSEWLMKMSRQSMLRDHDLRQIPNPVDHEVFAPMDRRNCRAELGLPQDKHVILFVSVAIKSWAKGGDLLARALDQLPERIKRNSVLLLMGARGEEFAEACGIEAVAAGYVTEDQKKVLMYGAADVLVQPSRAENQSLVALEAMSCGTPVVAFDVGGNAEIISAGAGGAGGLIVEPENVEQLSQSITAVLEDCSLREKLSAGGRRSVMANHTVDVHVQRYVALYEEKIAARAARPAEAGLAHGLPVIQR